MLHRSACNSDRCGIVFSHARYCVLSKDKTQWEVVDVAEFRLTTGMKFARFGISDVFSQTCYVQWMQGDQKIYGVEVLVKPMVLQRGSAACIHAAVEQAIPIFSELRLAHLCKSVGLVIVNSRPDACSANRRKLAYDQHQRASIDNCLELPGECGSHQAHRVVASREPDVRGGLDALACCGAHVAIQQRCLKVLWELVLEDMETGWIFASPDARDVARNRTIVKHTLLRHRTGGFDDIAADEYVASDAVADQVLSILGGSWDMPRLAHPCSGCCKTKEEAATKVMACLVSAGVTFNNDVRRPSMDDWGRCGQAAGVATFGCACHSILPRMFERVFPTYHVLPNDVDLAEESEIARAKLQKKANKVKFCMWNVGRKESLIVFALNGLHIEHLMLRLDAIDSRRVNGLLDLFEGVDKHPFKRFRKRLTMDLSCLEALTALTRTIFGTDTPLSRLQRRCCAVSVEFQAQIFFRFLRYDVDPSTFFRICSSTGGRKT
mgnify:CR=1 FL=1